MKVGNSVSTRLAKKVSRWGEGVFIGGVSVLRGLTACSGIDQGPCLSLVQFASPV
jgi:hypothetical protein